MELMQSQERVLRKGLAKAYASAAVNEGFLVKGITPINWASCLVWNMSWHSYSTKQTFTNARFKHLALDLSRKLTHDQ